MKDSKPISRRCAACKVTIYSLYPAQLEANWKSHLASRRHIRRTRK